MRLSNVQLDEDFDKTTISFIFDGGKVVEVSFSRGDSWKNTIGTLTIAIQEIIILGRSRR